MTNNATHHSNKYLLNKESTNKDPVTGNNSDSVYSNEDTAQVRKRIERLLEEKRLKELLDDTEDW